MSVIITNVSTHDGSELASDYVVRINRDPVIASFKHMRNEGLAACLRRAADAIDAAMAVTPFDKGAE